MKPFLEELAEEVIAAFPDQLDELTFVFPNKRAGLFFQKYLAAGINSPVWSPSVVPMESFIHSLSPLRLADSSFLVFELFRIYKELAPVEESFDKFFFWGEMLLSDFDTVDKFLTDAKMLFVNISQLKELDSALDYLLPEQLETIRSFWASFGTNRSRHQMEFISVWEILPQVYQRFRTRLEQQGIAYEGMIYRQVAQKAIAGNIEHPYKHVIFAGFDALTPAEEKVMEHFIQHHNALAYWNVDAYYMLDERQEAGRFLRRYANHKVLGKTFRQPFNHYLQNPDFKRHIEFVGVPLEAGQAKAMGEKLLTCLEQQTGIQLENTAIVLPEEHMLFPCLHAIPEHFSRPNGEQIPINNINVTMGYPLRNTPLYSLLENLVDLQQTAKKGKSGTVFHYRQVLAILRHPYVYYFESELARENIKQIEDRNRIYLSAASLNRKEHTLYTAIFKKAEAVNDVFDYLLDILMVINSSIDEENYEEPSLEQEYIYQFFTRLKRLRELIQHQQIELSLPVFLKLFRQIILSLRLPFSGEPLRGLQLMGVLETRNLDFENLFILSANEGSFPPSPGHHSFIPYNLRKGYGLPTHDREDSIYAYLFYSMLHKARNIHIFYNTETGFNMNGEMSRFLYQLMFESGLPVNRQVLSNQAQLARSLPVIIKKTPEVLKVLQKYVVKKEGSYRRLTPSALNTYLDCRLRFYYKYVAGISETDEVLEDVNAMVFGNILHLCMERLYKAFMLRQKRSVVNPEDFTLLRQLSVMVIDEAFSEHYGEGSDFEFEGKNLIVRSVVQKFVMAIIKCDEDYAPFEIISLEADDDKSADNDESAGFKVNLPIEAAGKSAEIGLKGIIDRVDRKEDKVRVVDYKTGKDKKRFPDIASLFDRNDKKRNKAAMQTLFYGMLYAHKFPHEEARIMPGLYNSKELFTKGFDIRLEIQSDKGKYQQINDVRPWLDEFKTGLKGLISEIYNPEVPFDQTEDLPKCSYCSFKNICHR